MKLLSLPLLFAVALAQDDTPISTTEMASTTEMPIETTVMPETTTELEIESEELCEENWINYQQTISMYNTEENYPHNACTKWHISAPAGMIIHLQPSVMDIESHPECSYDSLTVMEAEEEVNQWCSNDMTHFDTMGSDVTLVFRSDGSVARDGFEMIVDFTHPCTEETIYSADTIDFHTSDNYENSVCRIWRIVAPESRRIRMTPQTMNIESNTECGWDALTIMENNEEVHKYCGMDMTVLESSTNELVLKFTSDNSVARMGFEVDLEFFIPCINTDVRYAGMIDFSDEDMNYPHEICRTWTIYAPETRRIKLTPTLMDIEFHADCIWDKLSIWENDMEVHQYCGNDMTMVETEGNMVMLKFISDRSVNAAGFEINVEFEKICIHQYLTPNQWNAETIDFHFPEESYPHDSCMVWHINAMPNRYIVLSPTVMDIEQASTYSGPIHQEASSLCRWDAITVMEGEERLHKYCGNDMTQVISTGNEITVTFNSDMSVAREGFHIDVNVERICVEKEYTGQMDGSIALAGYGNHECYVWKIHAPEGKLIHVIPQAMDIESHWWCSYDKLNIYDGMDRFCPNSLLYTYCGEDETPIMSTTNELYVRFESDWLVTDDGFWLDWEVVDKPIKCMSAHFALTSELDMLMGNSEIGDQYSHSICETWTIHSVTGEPIHIDITSMDVEHHWSCDFDAVYVYDGIDEHCPLIHTYCGDNDYTPVSAESGHVFIKFVTDGSIASNGFSMLLHTHRPEPQLISDHGHIMNRFANGAQLCAAVEDFTAGHELFMTDCLRLDMPHYNMQWQYCEETKMIFSSCGNFCWVVDDSDNFDVTAVKITDDCEWPNNRNRFYYLKEMGQIAMADHRFGHKCINYGLSTHNILHVESCKEQNTFGLIPEV